jgi:hypothetical protein
MYKSFLGGFTISLRRAPTWTRVPRMKNKLTMYLSAESTLEYPNDSEALSM